MNSFLLEILVQELPYRFIPSAIVQLKSAFENLLETNSITYESVNTFATPRRLTVVIKGFEDSQKESEKIVKGPILTIAKDASGALTPAGIGFKNKNGANENDLFEQDGYIWAKIIQAGKDTKELLSQSIEGIILKLQGAHFMRWGDLDVKFSRPIENVLALYNNEILSLTVIDQKSGKTTLGHRYCPDNKIEITSPETYFEQLRGVNVIVDQEERKEIIIKLATQKAAEIGAVIDFKNNEELLEEITFITEYPIPVLCEFNKRYLEIPDIVTTTVMSKHQRYFPLYKDGKLLNYFITMANFVGTEGFENIQNGNQRVVTARLEDGIFFYKEDGKTKLAEKLEALKGMTFQKDFGTLYDKTQRVVKISQYIANELKVSDFKDIERTALLCKADLSTTLVFEFTELQGFIGAVYAKNDGENSAVSKGILEHYFPLGAGSELASSIEGQIVGIADKIDTICTVFLSTQGDKKKKRPTGSNDPLGVRRAVLGILRTILANNLNINITELIKYTLMVLETEFKVPQEDCLFDDIVEFISGRLVVMLSSEYNKELLDAALLGALDNLNSYSEKVKFLEETTKHEKFHLIHENALRITKIVPKQPYDGNIDSSKFTNEEENALYDFVSKTISDEFKACEKLLELSYKVAEFFEKTLVMDDNLAVRENHIKLLNLVKSKFDMIGDFTKITLRK